MNNKGHKQWVWLALDADTREIVGVYIGARDEAAAHQLWDSWPPVYRQCAIAYTDFWAAYGAVLPSKRHRAVGKETGKTNDIERFNHTLRQRVSRLVRKTLFFSKSLENHIGVIWYFIHHYIFSTTPLRVRLSPPYLLRSRSMVCRVRPGDSTFVPVLISQKPDGLRQF